MPIFPLPVGGTGLSGGYLPVTSTDDVMAVLPAFVRYSDSDPVRDALVIALTEIMLEYQRRSERAAAGSDILRAQGRELDELCAKRGVFRTKGETDPSLRTRTLSIQDYVTPAAILAAVDSILAPYTDIKAVYCESILDRWYVHDGGDHPWHSHVFVRKETTTPTYPDRLYPADEAVNGGYFAPQRVPMGAMAFQGHGGRQFFLRVPDLTPIDDTFSSVWREPVKTRMSLKGFYVCDGAVDQNGAYVRATANTATRLYQQIVSVVDRIKGQSIRWVLYADPRLKA